MSQCVQPRIEIDGSWHSRPAGKVLCPVCDDAYQHHGEVFVFQRDGEDGPTLVAATGRHDEALAASNPSSRRGAVRIFFTGECGHEWTLDVVQHKGETFLFGQVPS